jgi:hypothetical protein
MLVMSVVTAADARGMMGSEDDDDDEDMCSEHEEGTSATSTTISTTRKTGAAPRPKAMKVNEEVDDSDSHSSEAEYEPEYQEDPNRTYCCKLPYDDDREYVGCSSEVRQTSSQLSPRDA